MATIDSKNELVYTSSPENTTSEDEQVHQKVTPYPTADSLTLILMVEPPRSQIALCHNQLSELARLIAQEHYQLDPIDDEYVEDTPDQEADSLTLILMAEPSSRQIALSHNQLFELARLIAQEHHQLDPIDDKPDPEEKCLDNCTCLTFIQSVLSRVFPFITCQYIPPLTSKDSRKTWCFWLSYAICFTLIFGILLNLWPTAVFITDWIKCPIRYYGICYSLQLHSKDPNSPLIPDIVLKDNDNDVTAYNPDAFLNDTVTIHKLQEFEDFAKIVLVFSSASSSFSYLIFVIALWWLYIIPHIKKIKPIDDVLSEVGKNNKEIKPLHPFDDNDDSEKFCKNHDHKQCRQRNCRNCKLIKKSIANQDKDTTTELKANQALFFIIYLAVNIVIFIALALVFFFGQFLHKQLKPFDDDRYKTDTIMKWEIITVVVYLYSHFCTLSSCFIFSKIMYGIQSKCSNLIKYLDHVNNFEANKEYIWKYLATALSTKTITVTRHKIGQYSRETNILLYLKQRDKHFISVAVKTLKIFQFWYFVHWVFYILSSFLSVSLVLEVILLTIKGTLPHTQPGVHFKPLEIIFLVLFTSSNSLLFLYPCLRAGSITKSREKLIDDISSTYYKNIPDNVKNQYVKYLRAQQFCFRLNILCANIPFSVNIAYISICIGLLGVLVSVVLSISL